MPTPVIALTSAPNLVKNQRLDIATDGTYGSYTWTECLGLKSLTEANSYTAQDVSTFNTGIRAAGDMPVQFKKNLTGTLQEYVSTNAVHALLKAAGDALTLVAFRLYDRAGVGEAHEGTAFIQWEPQGGDGTAVKTNNFTLAIQDWTSITNPASITPTVVTLTSALPTAVAVGGWVEIIGTGFDSTITGVTVGGVSVGAAANRLMISSTKLHILMPAGSAGSAPIIVTNVAGASSALAYTRGA
jgi:hypothetical protein